MFDLKKLEDNNAIFWIFKFPEYRRIAAECGWAIAIHGSAVHDLDLMAMPWVENHTSADELAQRLTDTEQPNFRRPYEKSKPGDKPNGRIVYTIFTGGTYIDMNVIEKED
jgi:peptidoglycan/xylan/chitin deacetylase (PgdA/CDA1 family)